MAAASGAKSPGPMPVRPPRAAIKGCFAGDARLADHEGVAVHVGTTGSYYSLPANNMVRLMPDPSMLPAAAVLVMLVAVAGCCAYISYRVGQGISRQHGCCSDVLPASKRRSSRSDANIQKTLERSREETGQQVAQLLEEKCGVPRPARRPASQAAR